MGLHTADGCARVRTQRVAQLAALDAHLCRSKGTKVNPPLTHPAPEAKTVSYNLSLS